MEVLLEVNADPVARDKFDDLPFDFCQRNGMLIPMMIWHCTEKSHISVSTNLDRLIILWFEVCVH